MSRKELKNIHLFLDNATVPSKFFLEIDNSTVDSTTLNQLIKTEISNLKALQDKAPVFALRAHKSAKFIAQFFACLHLDQPVAIFQNDMSAYDMEKIQKIGNFLLLAHDANENNTFYKNDCVELLPGTSLILFTSGSTGASKAVALSKKNIAHNTLAVIESLDFEKSEQQILCLGLSYAFGLLGQLVPAVYRGLPTVLCEFNDLLKNKVTKTSMLSGVPSQLDFVLKAAGSFRKDYLNIKQFVAAGAFLDLEMREQFKKVLPDSVLYSNYGLTEAAPRVLSMNSNDVGFDQGYVGKAVGEIQLRINPENNQELQVKSEQVMLGYMGDPELTAKKIVGGWLQTHDCASIDEKTSLVKIQGRMDDMMKINGHKVYPLEVEGTLNKDPLIEESLVCLDKASPGEAIMCYLKVKSKAPNKNEIIQSLKAQFPSYKLPRRLIAVEQLPRTKNGKLKRRFDEGFFESQQTMEIRD